MREIKFRGKSIKSGKWYYGYFCEESVRKQSKKVSTIIENSWVIEGYGGKDYMGEERDAIIVEPKTVGQYTGMRDKTGKEIYEGDIIVCDYDTGKSYNRYVMEFSESAHAYLAKQVGSTCRIGSGYWGSTILVIGNIYENPELLGAMASGK